MSCACRKNVAESSESTTEAKTKAAVDNATEADLPQCYECAKKHLSRAQIFFEEYHTGYPQHIKNLMCSMKVAEEEVRSAYLLWCKIQAHLDMSANELLGREVNIGQIKVEHIDLANKIREVRLNLSTDPLYVPDFDTLLVSIQKLEYAED